MIFMSRHHIHYLLSECRESRLCENRVPNESNFCQESHSFCRDPTIHLKIWYSWIQMFEAKIKLQQMNVWCFALTGRKLINAFACFGWFGLSIILTYFFSDIDLFFFSSADLLSSVHAMQKTIVKKTTDRNQKYSFKFLVHQVNLSNKCMLCVGKIWENSKNSINFIRKIYRDQQHKRHIWYQTIGSTLKMHCFLG